MQIALITKALSYWEKLTKEIQDSESMSLFKKLIERQYNTFDTDFTV